MSASVSAADLLARVQAAGGHVEAVGDFVRVRGPAPLLDDDEFVSALQARKPELLTVLRRDARDQHAAIELLTAPDVRSCAVCGCRMWRTDRLGRNWCVRCPQEGGT